VWIGGLAILPAVAIAIAAADEEGSRKFAPPLPPSPIGSWSLDWSWLSTGTLTLFWCFAIGVPFLLAVVLRGRAAWKLLLWMAWAAVLLFVARVVGAPHLNRSFAATLGMYALLAVGSVGLVWWGLNEKRRERVNLGIAAFAISVLFFYFDGFMGKLGRSAGLLLLGVLCLAGGYVLEKTRRKLVGRMEAQS
jgi:hypothetical protein